MSKFLTLRNKAASRASRLAEIEHKVDDGSLAKGQMTVAESREVFLVLEDNFGGYHWELVAGNGEILLRSGNFASYDYADRAAGIALVATNRLVSHAAGHDRLARMAPTGWRDDGRSLSDAVKKWSVEA